MKITGLPIITHPYTDLKTFLEFFFFLFFSFFFLCAFSRGLVTLSDQLSIGFLSNTLSPLSISFLAGIDFKAKLFQHFSRAGRLSPQFFGIFTGPLLFLLFNCLFERFLGHYPHKLGHQRTEITTLDQHSNKMQIYAVKDPYNSLMHKADHRAPRMKQNLQIVKNNNDKIFWLTDTEVQTSSVIKWKLPLCRKCNAKNEISESRKECKTLRL